MAQVIRFHPRPTKAVQSSTTRLTPASQIALDVLNRIAESPDGIICTQSHADDASCSATYKLFGVHQVETQTPGGLELGNDRLTEVARKAARLLAIQTKANGKPNPEYWNRQASVAGDELEKTMVRKMSDKQKMKALTNAAESLHAREIAKSIWMHAADHAETVYMLDLANSAA